MPKFKPNPGPFRMNGYSYPGASPAKTRLGRWLMGRKKHVEEDGSTTITDKRGRVVKRKLADGTKVKYARGNRPVY